MITPEATATPCTGIMTTVIITKEKIIKVKETIIKVTETIIMVTETIIMVRGTIIINVALTIIIKGEMIDVIVREMIVTEVTNIRKGVVAEKELKMITSD